jgi:hypothetical protein
MKLNKPKFKPTYDEPFEKDEVELTNSEIEMLGKLMWYDYKHINVEDSDFRINELLEYCKSLKELLSSCGEDKTWIIENLKQITPIITDLLRYKNTHVFKINTK